MKSEALCITDELLELASGNGRLVPVPVRWNALWNILDKHVSNDLRKSALIAPLILAGWNFSSDQEKRTRFLEHLEWACVHGLSDRAYRYLSTLLDDEWYYGEKG
jgi:hypothetical protein